MSVDGDLGTTVVCPRCGRRVGAAPFCTHCGQALLGREEAQGTAGTGGPGASATAGASGTAGGAGEAHRGAADLEPPARQGGTGVDVPPVAPQVVACVRCGGVNAVSRERCGRCGTPLSTAATAPAEPADDEAGAPHAAAASAEAQTAEPPAMPGMIVILTVVLLAVTAAVALTLLSARGYGPFAGPDAPEPAVAGASAVEVAGVIVSSMLEAEGATTYGADNLVDGDPATAWNEAEPGDGVGEWVDVTLAEPTVVTSVVVWNGYQDGDFFARHNRVRRLQLTLGERTFAVRLLDRRGPQAITLPEPVAAERIRLRVAGTFPGTVYNDTALSELAVRGVPQDPATDTTD